MRIREHEGFQIHILDAGEGYIAEIHRKNRIVKTIRGENRGQAEEPFRTSAQAIAAAKSWIDQTYPRRIKYKGVI